MTTDYIDVFKDTIKSTLRRPLSKDIQLKLKEVLCNILVLWKRDDYYSAIIELCLFREMLFFEGDDIRPEQMHPHFVDIILDENMWEFIVDIKNKGLFLESNKEGMELIISDLNYCLEKEEVFA